ncbi:freyrasin family ranthipeptide [Trujillonella endophytica]|uniref:Uncharacterized protein n=1 Tax=Trujillonella endophytica TaxID=673521 RepID=A0A1H8SZR0_9ACTN|nr:freyrasin family ranthipeptide [Trujillella endophytica]SEO84035.1 hypothetical protein SAMN05660991_01946 [Trujillella endophytica]
MPDGENGPRNKAGRVRSNADLEHEVAEKGAEKVREELNTPSLDQIIKDLQAQHGVRVTLSPNLVQSLERLRLTSPNSNTLRSYCHPGDICILCDSRDLCNRCDALDFCITHDYHIVEEA